MRRTVLLLTGVLLAGMTLGSDSPKEYDDTTEVKTLEGSWRQVAVETAGKALAVPGNDARSLIFENGKVVWHDAHADFVATFTVNDRVKPNHLDMTIENLPEKWIPYMMLYRVDGDTLRLVFPKGPKMRYASFEEEGVHILIFKRVRN